MVITSQKVPNCHPEPFACRHPEQREGSRFSAQDKLREGSCNRFKNEILRPAQSRDSERQALSDGLFANTSMVVNKLPDNPFLRERRGGPYGFDRILGTGGSF
jgi:hypothetical protein